MMQDSQSVAISDRTEQSATRPKRVLISGATGLVGSSLTERLEARGQEPVRLVRSDPQAGDVVWDPATWKIDAGSLDADAVVHLAGENIADGRWTDRKMEAIRKSRVQGTRLLCESLARMAQPPSVLVSASAIGFYGDGGDEVLTEESPRGEGFLADVCDEWEEATQAAKDAGIRVVHLRIGVVLDSEGGALAKMLTPFKFGVGGQIGSGDQYMSWIALDDLVSAICHALEDEQLHGPVNATSPMPVTNREFTKTLGHVLHRPTIATMPAFAARLAFGKMADELLLASLRVVPKKLLANSFAFESPDLEGALQRILGAKS